MNTFGDGITVQTSTGERLGVHIWQRENLSPIIFLNGKVICTPDDATLTPWTCSSCHASKVFWSPRIAPRCWQCTPPTIAEKEFVIDYAVKCAEGIAKRLDDPLGKLQVFRILDEFVASGDLVKLNKLALEMLWIAFLSKHNLEDLL
ncbi:MAG: hypothetical protein Q8N04_03115 [Nitrospira sp.]|nr:hypothetical protein [Nitrospira sp.]